MCAREGIVFLVSYLETVQAYKENKIEIGPIYTAGRTSD